MTKKWEDVKTIAVYSKPLEVVIILKDEKGASIARLHTGLVKPGDTVTWKYPKDGLVVEVSQ